MTKKSSKFYETDLPLLTQAGAFAMWKAWRKAGMENIVATYDLTVREMSSKRKFLIFSGLEEVLSDLTHWVYSKEDIAALKKHRLIDKHMAERLKKFKFLSDIFALREGTPFFPGETVMRFTGPLWQLELFYAYLVNAVSSNTTFSSKNIRVVLAAQGKPVILPVTRSQGFESSLKCMRGLYMVGGNPSSSQLFFWKKYGLEAPKKVLNALTHAFIKSFPSEIEAMRAFISEFPNDEAVVLVDTYDFEKGVDNLIIVSEEMRKSGGKVAMLYIDSGDLIKRTKYARSRLDSKGFKDIKILLSGNLDEQEISKIIQKKTPCDGFLLITELVTSPDAPKLEVVYKLAELQDGTKIRPVMKLAKNKRSFPGKKQVFRIYDKDGFMVKDVIGLDGEAMSGEPLLIEMLRHGKLVKPLPELSDIRKYCLLEIEKLPAYLKKIDEKDGKQYPVEYSKKILELAAKTEAEMH